MIGTRTLLVAAGLPGHVWSYAAPCYMHLDNCTPHVKMGQSAWSVRYGEELRGQLIPFGAAVMYKRSPTKLVPHNALPAASVGILLGCRFALGGSWHGAYVVEELSYFLDVAFRMDSPGHSKWQPLFQCQSAELIAIIASAKNKPILCHTLVGVKFGLKF